MFGDQELIKQPTMKCQMPAQLQNLGGAHSTESSAHALNIWTHNSSVCFCPIHLSGTPWYLILLAAQTHPENTTCSTPSAEFCPAVWERPIKLKMKKNKIKNTTRTWPVPATFSSHRHTQSIEQETHNMTPYDSCRLENQVHQPPPRSHYPTWISNPDWANIFWIPGSWVFLPNSKCSSIPTRSEQEINLCTGALCKRPVITALSLVQGARSCIHPLQ